ncbi:MarR family winged helix-turn-helix transcriptional regulator [Antribacter gilvus]|uniref:MarR family winged helix-turn-helix transcriptional regulator n=1 Tax=Antribacter gilvus TaxID=2304675 RepID=UPI000F780CA3|nr:MarR family winged helix-turn-helix transcriptional regulator [Antribacter gilvus]
MQPPGHERLLADLSSRLGHAVKRVEQVLMAEKSHALRAFGLTVPQYATLLALHHVPGQSAAQLARTALVTPQTMATILGNLEEKRLVSRDVSALHAKVLVTDLTDEGRTLFTEADATVRRIEDNLRAAYSDEEFDQLRALLQRAEDTIRQGAAG